jgi:hypothetical protein
MPEHMWATWQPTLPISSVAIDIDATEKHKSSGCVLFLQNAHLLFSALLVFLGSGYG